MSSPERILWDSGRSEPAAARVAIGGDFLPAGALTLPPGGWNEAARKLAAHLDDVDLSFVNLESALDVGGLPARLLGGLGQIVSAPSASLDYLVAIRSPAVSLANNHSYDFGAAGVQRTRHALLQRGIVPLGAGETLRSAPGAFVWQGPGSVRVGFWAAARASHDLATRSRAGVEPATLTRAGQAHDALRSARATFSIALLHAGCQRTNRVDPADARLIDGIARQGFQIVAASHSHFIGGATFIAAQPGAPSFSFYGLGSIVSGYVASPLEREGLIVVVSLHSDGSLARVAVRPVALAQSGFGEVPSPEASRVILNRFRSLSTEIANGSATRLFYRDLSPGLAGLYFRDASAAFRELGVRGLFRKAGRVRMRHVRRLVHGLIG